MSAVLSFLLKSISKAPPVVTVSVSETTEGESEAEYTLRVI
jgi:hypothetical protein